MSPFRLNPSRTALQRLGARAVFAGSLLIFLVVGIVLVGDFSAQWWLLIFPVAVLVGPVLDVIRESGQRRDPGWETTRRG
ncbi:MAG: hypothetical protein M3400_17010 [Actinomycetota bacterium]|nr:hypothetical protein [Actinomycetota bacterium]